MSTAQNTTAPLPSKVWHKICHPNETTPKTATQPDTTPHMVAPSVWSAQTREFRKGHNPG